MATYIAWKNYYTVNDPALDAEHKQILECINELYSALEGEWQEQAEARKGVLDRLVQYTRFHFDHEEEVMRAVEFPGFRAHKALHDSMRQRTIGLRTNLSVVTARDVLVFLKDWWLDHIQGEDKQYAVYLELQTAK